VGQAYLTLYVAYFLGLVLLLQCAAVGLLHRRSLPWADIMTPGRREWAGRLLVAAGAGLALLPLFIPHVLAGREHGHYPFQTIRDFCPTPWAWATPADLAWHRDWMPAPPSDTLYPCEKQLFPGLVPLAALVGAGLMFTRRPAVAVAAVTVLLAVVLTTRVGGYALYDPLLYLPGVPGMRVVSRVALVLLFPLAVLVAALTAELTRRAGRLGPVCAAVVLGLLVADQWLVRRDGPRGHEWAAYRFPKAEAVARRERLAEVIRRHPDPRLVYVFPDPSDDPGPSLVRQVDAMLASQQIGIPTVNGWSGYWPPGYGWLNDYRSLLGWLTEQGVSPDTLAGLVVVGEPRDDGSEYERQMRAKYPPLPIP
jgi:hypothetical protein